MLEKLLEANEIKPTFHKCEGGNCFIIENPCQGFFRVSHDVDKAKLTEAYARAGYYCSHVLATPFYDWFEVGKRVEATSAVSL